MRKPVLLLLGLALIAPACGGGGASCADIVDDGIVLFQDVIDGLDGLQLADIQDDPFESEDFERRSDELDERTAEAGCTDEELTELFTARVGDLSAGSSNPAGQFMVSLLVAGAESGELSFGG